MGLSGNDFFPYGFRSVLFYLVLGLAEQHFSNGHQLKHMSDCLRRKKGVIFFSLMTSSTSLCIHSLGDGVHRHSEFDFYFL